MAGQVLPKMTAFACDISTVCLPIATWISPNWTSNCLARSLIDDTYADKCPDKLAPTIENIKFENKMGEISENAPPIKR